MITRHSAHAPPGDALERLWPRLDGAGSRDLRFVKGRAEIRALAPDDPRVPMAGDEWVDDCRRTILQTLRSVCEQAPDLEFDWFAVWRR